MQNEIKRDEIGPSWNFGVFCLSIYFTSFFSTDSTEKAFILYRPKKYRFGLKFLPIWSALVMTDYN